jgi:cell division transport system ATP-binding protein
MILSLFLLMNGNLDPQTSTEVLEVLRKINENGKNIITHDYALLMKFPSKQNVKTQKIFEVVQRK